MEAISQDVIIQAAQGDIKAFEEIYKKASSMVYGIALRITKSSAEAEEVTQDVFIKIHKNLSRFCFKSSFKTWAYRIAVNTAINAYKRNKTHEQRESSLDEHGDIIYHDETIRQDIDLRDQETKIQKMLSVLNLDQKTCMIMREIEGLSYKEIAEALGININTVRTRLKRARTTLISMYRNGGQIK